MFKRTHNCGELRRTDIGETVNLNGWVNTIRLHGQVVFVDLRDRYGKTQIVFNADSYGGDFEVVKKLSMEDVLSITGKVRERSESAVNPNLMTGEIEVVISDYSMLNFSLRTRLPLSYLTTGQRVPEDIEVAAQDRVIRLIFN